MRRIAVVIFLLAPPMIASFPTGTGSCSAGTGAILTPGLTHAINTQVGTGALSDGGIRVLFNDKPLIEPFADIVLFQQYNVTLVAEKTPFRGFLIRMEGNDRFLDTTQALQSYDSQVQVARLCQSVNRVGGVCHTSNDEKAAISATLVMKEPAFNLLLDITVIMRNRQGMSEWYYSRYTLNAVDPSTMETTLVPSQAPVLEETIANVQMTLWGVSLLSEDSIQTWKQVTTKWYQDYFDTHFSVNAILLTSLQVTKQVTQPQIQLTLIYNPTLTFTTTNSMSIFDIVLEPFAVQASRDEYADMLQASQNDAFASIQTVSNVKVSTHTTARMSAQVPNSSAWNLSKRWGATVFMIANIVMYCM